jgi:hypothetical protein
VKKHEEYLDSWEQVFDCFSVNGYEARRLATAGADFLAQLDKAVNV